jgi:hypothetical protein
MTKTRNVARKITVSDVCGKIPAHSIKEPKALMNVLAKITSATPQETQFGPYLDFRGQFEAVNLETGEVLRGSRMIMPSLIEQELSAALEEAEQTDGGVVLAAFTVGVEPSERGSTGYAYTLTVAEIGGDEVADPFAGFREIAVASLPAPSADKALPSPDAAEKPAKVNKS